MSKVLIALTICLVDLPVGAVATFLLAPFWRWFEMATGIESIGHSGPSEWCFIAVYLLLLAASFGICASHKRTPQARLKSVDPNAAETAGLMDSDASSALAPHAPRPSFRSLRLQSIRFNC